MSMDRCYRCSRQIDTDFDFECYVETKYGNFCTCEPCRERDEAMRDKGDAMAALAEDRESVA